MGINRGRSYSIQYRVLMQQLTLLGYLRGPRRAALTGRSDRAPRGKGRPASRSKSFPDRFSLGPMRSRVPVSLEDVGAEPHLPLR